jgi:hypothetical protein
MVANKTDGLTNVDQTPGGEAPPLAVKNPPKRLIGVLIFAALAIVAFVIAIALLKPPGS